MYLRTVWIHWVLPPTLHQVSIYLLLKKGKDPLSCSSYYPISFLNVDITILAKVLALRLESVFPQTKQASLKIDSLSSVLSEYSISFTLHLCHSFRRFPCHWMLRKPLIVCSEATCYMLFLDLALVMFLFPRLNYYTLSYFQRQRGKSQGCSLSLLLFALVMEPLTISIQHSTDIKRIFRANQEHKGVSADDVLLYVSDPL